MKKQMCHMRFPLIAVIFLAGLTSCGDLKHELVINPDGSGTLETNMDIGEMMSMVQGMGELDDLMIEDVTVEGDTEIESMEIDSTTLEEEAKDPMQAIMDRVSDPDYAVDFDTLMPILTIMPDSVKEKAKEKDLLEKISIRMQSPANSASLIVGIVMNFDDQAQLYDIVNQMESLNDKSSSDLMSGSGGGLAPETFLVFDMNMNEGWIRFDTLDYSSFGAGTGMAGDSTDTNEEMAMMEMMFGNSKIKSTIHVPGEVTACTHQDAILTKDNKVIVEHNFMDVIRDGKLPGYTIYFTPKK